MHDMMCIYENLQGDLGPFNPGLPVEVPVWLALNLKQRQKCRIVPPEWMDTGEFNHIHSCAGTPSLLKPALNT